MPGYGVIPSIRVRDVKGVVDFYTNTLGFDLIRGPADDNNSLQRGDARIMIEAPAAFYAESYNKAIANRAGTPSANAYYIEANDLDALYEKVMSGGANVIDPLAERPWGQREFTVEDPAGNWLTFWQASEEH